METFNPIPTGTLFSNNQMNLDDESARSRQADMLLAENARKKLFQLMEQPPVNSGALTIDVLNQTPNPYTQNPFLFEPMKSAQQPSIAQQVMQEAQGIESARSNLPETYADGGILNFQPENTTDGNDGYAGGGMVAFERGGIASLPVKRYSGVYPEGSFVFEDVYGGEPYGKAAARTPTLGTKEVLNNLEKAKKAEAAAKAAKTAKDVATGIEVAAPAGKLYNAARTVGSLARSAPQAVAASEVLGSLGSYKFQEPGLDTSVSGVYNAAKKGDYGQAWRNLYMGLPEAGMDLMRAGAGVGDIFVPGTPISDALDKRLKERWNVTTPSDKAAAPATSPASPATSPAAAPAAPAAPVAPPSASSHGPVRPPCPDIDS